MTESFIFFPFFFTGEVLNVCSVAKYLGHYCTDDLSDGKDIAKQCRKLYAQGNTLVRKCHMCTTEVKVCHICIYLFRTYCTHLYTANLWFNYCKYSMKRLIVAYNDTKKTFLRIPRYMRASQMFAAHQVHACQAVCRNLMFTFIIRLDRSENRIISYLVCSAKSDIRYS